VVFNAIALYVQAMFTVYQTAWNAIVLIVQTAIGIVQTVIGTLAEIPVKVATWFLQAKDGISTALTGAVEFVTGIPAKIIGALGNVGTLLFDAGKAIIGGLLSGITEKFEDVKNFVGGIGSWIADHKGPLTYDRQLLIPAGVAIMDGLEEGLRSRMSRLALTTDDINASMRGIVGGRTAQSGSLDNSSRSEIAAAVNGSRDSALIAEMRAMREEYRRTLDMQVAMKRQGAL